MFKRMGVLRFAPGADEDKITEAAIEAGADDVVAYPEDGAIDVLTTPESFESVRDAMKAAGAAADDAEVTYRADNDIAVDGDTAQQVVKPLDWLADMDDGRNVYSHAQMDEGASGRRRASPFGHPSLRAQTIERAAGRDREG